MRMPYPDKLRKMISEAMKELAPQMYSRLKKSGELEKVVEMRAQAAEEQYDEMMELVSPADQKEIHQAQKKRGLAVMQAWNRRESRIVENVLAQATEFPTEGEDRTI